MGPGQGMQKRKALWVLTSGKKNVENLSVPDTPLAFPRLRKRLSEPQFLSLYSGPTVPTVFPELVPPQGHRGPSYPSKICFSRCLSAIMLPVPPLLFEPQYS